MQSGITLEVRDPAEFKRIMPKLVKLTAKASARRPGLTAVLFSPRWIEGEDGKKEARLYCVATDARRLARVSFALESLEMVGLPEVDEADAKECAISGRNVGLDPFPVLVPTYLITDAARAISTKRGTCPGPLFFRYDGENREIEFQVNRSVFRGKAETDGTFPGQYHDLLGANGRDVRVGLNVQYMREVLDLFWACTGEVTEVQIKRGEDNGPSETAVRFLPVPGSGSVRTQNQYVEDIEAIVMPRLLS